MVHRKNHDLKAELAEAQIAAQQWEQKYLEQRELTRIKDASLAAHAHGFTCLESELAAVTNTLYICRKERGEALDALHEAIDLMSEATDYIEHTSGDLLERAMAFEARFPKPVTAAVDPMDYVGVTEMRTTGPIELTGTLGRIHSVNGQVLEHEEESE